MNKMPLVTIMIPSYNHENYIAETIESVINQTYENLEILIADDGSTDNSVNIIQSFADSRIKLFLYPENTCFRTWDVLRDHATGEYVAYIGSDDIMEPDKIEKQVAFLQEHKEYQACFTWARGIDQDSNVLTDNSMENCYWVDNRTREQWIHQLTMENNCIVAPSMLMHTKAFQDLKGFDMSYRQIPDWDLWLRFLTKYQFYILNEPLLKYRVHPDDMNANVSSVTEENSIRLNYEHAHMLGTYIKHMEPLLFQKTFLQEKNLERGLSATEEKCEKFFWMLNHFSAELQTTAIYYYLDQSRDADFLDCMEKRYHFSRKDFFEIERTKGSSVVISESKKEAMECAKMAEQAISYLERVQRNME